MRKMTKLDLDLSVLPPESTGHVYVRFEHPLLASPLDLAVVAPPKDVKHAEAVEWASSLEMGEHKHRLITPEEAFLIPDRSRTSYPLTDAGYLPNHAGRVIWTSALDLTDSLGYAWLVSLRFGGSFVDHQDG